MVQDSPAWIFWTQNDASQSGMGVNEAFTVQSDQQMILRWTGFYMEDVAWLDGGFVLSQSGPRGELQMLVDRAIAKAICTWGRDRLATTRPL